MSFDLYKQILNMFPEKPDLKALKAGMMIPENWPFLLGKTVYSNKNLLKFEISDLNNSIICEVKTLDMINKVSLIDKGQIVFLYDSLVIKNTLSEDFSIDVKLLFTLKEVNDGLPKTLRKRDKRSVYQGRAKEKGTKLSSNTEKPLKSDQPDSRWRTLAERWQKQGKIGT